MNLDRALRLLTVLAALALPLVAGCDVGGMTDPDTGPRRDAGAPPDAGDVPMDDGGMLEPVCTAESMGSTIGETCFRDRDCSDGCFCNGAELCRSNVCVAGPDACPVSGCATASCDEDEDACDYTTDDAMCDDGVFCNGAELCDPLRGCRPGARPFCGDGDFCTVDYCDEAVGACAHDPLDVDGDGYAGTTCGGMDCDDTNALISPDGTEICGNGRDDDCNGNTDIADEACRSTNDRCTAGSDGRGPEDITPSGTGTFTFSRTTAAMDHDYDLSCATRAALTTGPDAVFSFTLDADADVLFEVLGVGNDAALALRSLSACASGPDLKCASPSSSRDVPTLSRQNLAAGDYALIVVTENPTPFRLQMTVGAASGAQQDLCADDAIDISAGGSFSGSLLSPDATHDYQMPCRTSSTQYRDVALRLVVPAGESRDVTLAATSERAGSGAREPYLALVSDCSAESPAVSECVEAPNDSTPARIVYRGLPEGTYYVLIEGEATSDDAWALEATVEASAGRTAGDACDAGIPIPIDGAAGVVDLSTIDSGPDEGAFCGANRAGYRDFFYTFTLGAEQDVEVTTSGTARHWAGVSQTCGAVPLNRDCFYAPDGGTTRRYLRLPAGTHYLNVSALAETGSVTASINVLAPTPAPSNDTCASAAAIADGESLSLDLSVYTHTESLCGTGDDAFDAFYTFTLTETRFVYARADGASALGLIESCGSSPTICDGGFPPRIEQTLDAGTYVLAVTSPPDDAGPVTLRFSTTAP